MRRHYNNGDYDGQHGHANWYCPVCKATGKSAHEQGCDGQKIEISPTARFPKKSSSKKVWEEFYRKFVLQEDVIKSIKARRDKSKYE